MVNTTEGRPPLHQIQMKLFNAIAAAAAVITCCIGTTIPANASIRIDLAGEMQTMLICNDNAPYIYANNDRTWNKAYSTSSFTKTADGKIPRGSCDVVILDTANEYTQVTRFKVASGSRALEMRSMGWEILFDKAKPNPSKYNNPRPLASACIGQLDQIPVNKIKSFCFK